MSPAFKRFPLFRFLASLKITLLLFLVFAVSIAAATFLEGSYGLEGARGMVYDALWFEILLAALTINLVALLLLRMPYRRRQTGFVMVHIAVILILLSAGITRFFGYEGNMPIREGQSTDYLYSRLQYIGLSNDGASEYKPINLYRPGKQSFRKSYQLGEERYRVSVREYWPHYEETLQEGEGGVSALNYATFTQGSMKQGTIFVGDTQSLGSLQVHFVKDALPAVKGGGNYGSLEIPSEGDPVSLLLTPNLPLEKKVGDRIFRILEFHPDYARRDMVHAPEEMKNPMIRVEVEGPEGVLGERILFAFFPDFGMGHAGQSEELAQLPLRYRYENGLALLLKADGSLEARASVDMEKVDMETGEAKETLTAGTTFSVGEKEVLRAGDFSFVPVEIYESAIWVPGPSENEKKPAGVWVEVRNPEGESGKILLTQGGRGANRLTLGDETLSLHWGSRKIQLDYSLYLDDFQLLTYPGSNNPASYESHVRLFDEEAGIDGQEFRIYMNHPLSHRGNKHFQSSYDPDRKGTVLSVNHDPGKWPTYISYILITLGFILVLAKNWIWPVGKASS
ncbi:MAG: cytochrome c biogenesis protein ResB [Candidatus Krumholzibacteria bacterium]|nr:cytochrome c biogenesis protein ResB [Candidatus Krumholzibacteria bacterium]MDP6797400.1 cytochrome c biogenesis protein ResB [Candidatus Krumholzibacteria bacterium]MDP7021044.1 cytochrome c biogenesis protein ResB [Candidatus Krumholzibacteria bacterium]